MSHGFSHFTDSRLLRRADFVQTLPVGLGDLIEAASSFPMQGLEANELQRLDDISQKDVVALVGRP